MLKSLRHLLSGRGHRLDSPSPDDTEPVPTEHAQTPGSDLQAEAARLKSSGNAHLAEGRLDPAVADYRAAIVFAPQAAELHVNLGFALKEQGRLPLAEPSLREATRLAPDSFDARYLYGMVLAELGRTDAAIGELQAAMALRPEFADGHSELCRLLLKAGQGERAKALMREAICRHPTQASMHLLLGNLHAHTLENSQAIACFRRAIELGPTFAQACNNLGLVLEKRGQTREAISQFRRAIELAPDTWEFRRNLLFTLSYDVATAPCDYLAEAGRCGNALMAKARLFTEWPEADACPPGRLRIGLLSGDFRAHPVGYFLEALLTAWDSERIELYAYSANPQDDEATARLKPWFAAWRPVALASDESLAQLIHADGVQILIDLAGHTDLSRLPVLAWRPAPVQVSWLGFWASTGLRTADWFIADPVSAPEEQDAHFGERVWRLPATRLCFSPPRDGEPAVGPLPALSNGYVTFGCFQSLTKINDGVLALWAEILQALPTARLRVQDKQIADTSLRDDFMRRCATAGLDVARIAAYPAVPRTQYLAAHHEVDLLLDTFPFSGATTTCEALWMGVPTVTLAGDRLVARQGASLMGCVGLQDWIAADPDDYVERAVRHASDAAGLASLRSEQRARLLGSTVCDAPAFARQLQATLRRMWEERERFPTR